MSTSGDPTAPTGTELADFGNAVPARLLASSGRSG